METIIIIIMIGLLGTGLGIISTGNLLWGIGFMLAGIILLLLCLRNISAAPPYVGLITIWGEKKPEIKKEGWRIIAPFFPFWLDIILVCMEKRNKDFDPKIVRTSEQAELTIRVSITWTPDESNLIEYVNIGGQKNVENIFDDIVEQECREYAYDKTWVQCLEQREEMIETLITVITGESNPEIIKDARRGNSKIPIPSLGIVLNRLNIGAITISPNLSAEAEKIAIEQRKRDAETIQLNHVKQRILELMKGTSLTEYEAMEAIQTERGKITKEIKEYKGFKGIIQLQFKK